MGPAFSKHPIGVVCCVIALAACLAACILTRHRRERWRVLVSLTVLQSALTVDMLFSLRWLLHNEVADGFRARGVYDERVGPQHYALLLVAAATFGGIWLLLKRLRGRTGAQLAWCGMVLWIASWIAQLISLHSMDVFFHERVAHVLVRDLVWIVSCVMISCGVLLDAKRAPAIESRRSVQTR